MSDASACVQPLLGGKVGGHTHGAADRLGKLHSQRCSLRTLQKQCVIQELVLSNPGPNPCQTRAALEAGKQELLCQREPTEEEREAGKGRHYGLSFQI